MHPELYSINCSQSCLYVLHRNPESGKEYLPSEWRKVLNRTGLVCGTLLVMVHMCSTCTIWQTDKGWYSMVLYLLAQRMTLVLFIRTLTAQKPNIKQLTNIRWFAHSAEGICHSKEELPSWTKLLHQHKSGQRFHLAMASPHNLELL